MSHATVTNQMLYFREIKLTVAFLFYSSLFLLAITCLPSVYAKENTPSLSYKNTPEEKESDILASINGIISLSGKLAEELDKIPKNYFWGDSDKTKIQNLVELSKKTQQDFTQLANFLAQTGNTENQNKDIAKIDEHELKDLVAALKNSLREFLDELRYVFNDSVVRSISETLDSLEPRKLTQRDLIKLEDDEVLDTLLLINEDPHKYNEALIKYNDLLLKEEALSNSNTNTQQN